MISYTVRICSHCSFVLRKVSVFLLLMSVMKSCHVAAQLMHTKQHKHRWHCWIWHVYACVQNSSLVHYSLNGEYCIIHSCDVTYPLVEKKLYLKSHLTVWNGFYFLFFCFCWTLRLQTTKWIWVRFSHFCCQISAACLKKTLISLQGLSCFINILTSNSKPGVLGNIFCIFNSIKPKMMTYQGFQKIKIIPINVLLLMLSHAAAF